jgi:transcriptional regulator with XRE-family HTH domain
MMITAGSRFNYLEVMTETSPHVFGPVLATVRRQQRLSQEALGARAGVSQRHLSFLESGRAQPGRAVIGKLIDALDLDYSGANQLLIAAGFAPARATLSWDDPQLAETRHAVTLMLDKHEPFPAMAMNRAGDVNATTAGLDALLDEAGVADAWERTSVGGQRNLFDLSLHPHGIIRKLRNPDQVVPYTLRRLRRAAASHLGASATWQRVQAYPCTTRWPADRVADRVVSGGVIVEEYAVGDHLLRLASVTSTFGNPDDVTTQDLLIELLYPVDRASERLLCALVGA